MLGQTLCATQAVAQTTWSCVVWFDYLYNSLKRVWTCLRAAVPRHQFIIDSLTVRIFFSKCHTQLQIKNSGRNLYSYTSSFQPIFCPNTPFLLPVYGVFFRRISKQPNRQDLDMFSLWHLPRDWSVRKLIVHYLLLYNTLLRKFVWRCIGPFTHREPTSMNHSPWVLLVAACLCNMTPSHRVMCPILDEIMVWRRLL